MLHHCENNGVEATAPTISTGQSEGARRDGGEDFATDADQMNRVIERERGEATAPASACGQSEAVRCRDDIATNAHKVSGIEAAVMSTTPTSIPDPINMMNTPKGVTRSFRRPLRERQSLPACTPATSSGEISFKAPLSETSMRSKRTVRRPSLDYHDTVDKVPSRSPSSTRSTSVESVRSPHARERGCSQRSHPSNNAGTAEESTGLTPVVNRMSMRRSAEIGPSSSQAIETDSRGCTPELSQRSRRIPTRRTLDYDDIVTRDHSMSPSSSRASSVHSRFSEKECDRSRNLGDLPQRPCCSYASIESEESRGCNSETPSHRPKRNLKRPSFDYDDIIGAEQSVSPSSSRASSVQPFPIEDSPRRKRSMRMAPSDSNRSRMVQIPAESSFPFYLQPQYEPGFRRPTTNRVEKICNDLMRFGGDFEEWQDRVDPQPSPFAPRTNRPIRKKRYLTMESKRKADREDQRKYYNKQKLKKDDEEKKKKTMKPKWCETSNVGTLDERCLYCAALHFPKENHKCCDGGKVVLSLPPHPPELLWDLLDVRKELGRKYAKKLSPINTLYSFGAKSCAEERIPGRGVPITKVRGAFAHTMSSVLMRRGETPRFGTLYALDSMEEATRLRRENERLSTGIEEDLLYQLGVMFKEINSHAMKFKFMKDVLEREDPRKPVRLFRLLTKEQASNNAQARAIMENDHVGRYNAPDSTMVLAVYRTDDDGVPLLPNGVNVYPEFKGGDGEDLPFFCPLIDSLCYPLIYPYGEVLFENSTIPLRKPEKMCEETMKYFENVDLNDREIPDDNEDTADDDLDSMDGGDQEVITGESDVEENVVLRPTEDDELESDPPTDDEREDLPLLPSIRTDEAADLPDAVQSPGETPENSEDERNPDSDVEEFEEGGDISHTNVVSSESEEEDHSQATPNTRGTSRRHVSHRQYLRYQVARRNKSKYEYHRIWSATRVAQHYVIDSMLRIKAQRDWHVKQNYTQTLSSQKNGFLRSMNKISSSKGGGRVGMAVTVPSSVKGSPAYLRKKYEDTMTMVSELGNPDLFITFTGNRKWPEIERERKPGQTWADIADIAVRVFMLKFKQLKDLLFKQQVFGKVAGYAYSIELQQRGMPHAHILIILDKKDKLDTPAKVDKVVWSHIPDPSGVKKAEDKAYLEKVRELVEKHMIHTPCEGDPDSYCRAKCKKKNGKRCSKGFPKEFSEVTEFVSDGYVLPKRPDNGQKIIKPVSKKGGDVEDRVATNAYVVAYNPALLLMFDCHINVEMCSTVKACKYIFKYIFKGYDKTLVQWFERCRSNNGRSGGAPGAAPIVTGGRHVIFPNGASVQKAKLAAIERDAKKRLHAAGIPLRDENGVTLVYDETTIIESMRATTVTEALLDVFEIPTAVANYAVISMSVHEPGGETICWKKGREEEKARALQTSAATSQLTAWFELNRRDSEACNYTYLEIPRHYLWVHQKKKWQKRKNTIKVIGRIYPVMPRFAEKFAIRMLALHVRGPKSFEDLRTLPDGTVCNTFTEAAKARGLMDDEREWEYAMEEAAKVKMPRDIRRLFATIIAYCPVKDKQGLFDKFAAEMYDRGGEIEETKRARALYHINSILEHNQLNNTIVGLEQAHADDLHWGDEDSRDWNDSNEVGVSPEEAQEIALEMMAKMNDDQRKAFRRILRAYQNNEGQRCFFLDGPGGTGKTFVYKAVYYAIIGAGGKALMVAHTGIAATLLINGSTVHRQFCIPVGATGDSKCNVAPDSKMEAQLRDADVIIWDEACMSDKRVLHCVEKLLCELNVTAQPLFGGKLMLLGGDWKQLLPVVRSTYGLDILDYTLKKSHLWEKFDIIKLTKNMRLDEGSGEYAELLDNIGRGDSSIHDEYSYAQIRQSHPELMANSEEEIISFIYGDELSVDNVDTIKDSCILTPLNDAALEINHKVLEMLPGETFISYSVDRCNKESRFMELPTETYNRITPMGMPPHELKLKRGCIVMLLRNINVSQGQCNGTRLRVVEMSEHLLTCENITSGRFEGTTVLIPRIEMEPGDQTDPSHFFARRQFPVRLAYAITINKAQGQSLKKVGIVLRTPVFSHGQLYVAMSRATTRTGVKIYQKENMALPEDYDELEEDRGIFNKVFKEILV